MLSFQNVTVPAGTVPSGKLELFETSRRYVTASGTADQSKWMNSHGWNVEYPRVGASTGVPGAPGPVPVTWKLRTADHALVCSAESTAFTRQKYVPATRPLTVSCVVVALVESTSTSGLKLADVLTCQL